MSEELKNQLEEKRAKAMECRDSFRDFKRSAPAKSALLAATISSAGPVVFLAFVQWHFFLKAGLDVF